MHQFLNVRVEPATLRTAREELQLTREQVQEYFSSAATRAQFGVDARYLEQIETTASEIPFGVLEILSIFYDKPVAYFYSHNPKKQLIIDPRTDKRTFTSDLLPKGIVSRDTLIEIKRAKAVQLFAHEELSKVYARAKQVERLSLSANVSVVAAQYKDMFDLEGRDFKGKYKKYFDYLRTRIESLGIIVIQAPFSLEDNIRGLSFTTHQPYLIIVNKKDGYEMSYAPRIFTLIHELGHILLRDDALCDENPYSRSRQEVFCNKLAAHFLLPREQFSYAVKELTSKRLPWLKIVEELRKVFTVSFDVVAWRLKELAYLDQSSVEGLIAEWRKKNKDAFLPTNLRSPKVWTVVGNTFGEMLPRELLKHDSAISPIQIARVLNIKLDDYVAVRKAFE
jgi:Zn-dependent peptidase ImmA (M78 family)/transcriptional regulator with XRE-family HTH domain